MSKNSQNWLKKWMIFKWLESIFKGIFNNYPTTHEKSTSADISLPVRLQTTTG